MTPGQRLAAVLVVIVVTALADLGRPAGVGLLAGLAAVAVVASPGAPTMLLRRVRPLVLCAVIGLLLLLLVPVQPGAETMLLPGWSRSVDAAAARLLVAFWVKAGLLITWVTAATARLTERDLLEGLRALRLPPMVASLAYLMLHNLGWVADETRRLLRARDARGRPRGWRAVTTAAAIAGTLLWHLGRRAEVQALALAARGYRGELTVAAVRYLRVADLAGLLLYGLALRWLSLR